MTNILFTYPNGVVVREPALNPFKRGDRVVIPSGTWVRRMGKKDSGRSGRRDVITFDHGMDGYLVHVQTRAFNGLTHKYPSIRWAGSGGYWADCDLTEEVMEANGMSYSDLQPNPQSLRAFRHEIEYLIREGKVQ